MDREQIKEAAVSIVLPLLLTTTMLAVAAIAPNAVQIFDVFGKPRRFNRHKLRMSLRRMENNGYVRHVGQRTAWEYRLTKKGRVLLAKKQMEQLKIPIPRRWDQKWRVVAFDVPERLRTARDALRWHLRSMGFRCLNLSVWVHPYECQNEINALVGYYRVGRYARYLRVDYFDGQDAMRMHFNVH